MSERRRDDLLRRLAAGGMSMPAPVKWAIVATLVFMTVWGFVRSLT